MKKDENDEEKIDPEVSLISSKKQVGLRENQNSQFRAASGWHSDIAFESVPADYSILKIIESPPTGGDTLWASGYSLYDKLSPSFRSYLETLTGTYSQPRFKQKAEGKYEIHSGQRGAPENVGDELTAIHPIIRSNPVTGWKSLFAVGNQFTKFNGLTEDESQNIKQYLRELLVASHDIHVRIRWSENDVAIWDNRSVYHSATKDYDASKYRRTGVRTVGIGERPALAKNAKSRAEDLA